METKGSLLFCGGGSHAFTPIRKAMSGVWWGDTVLLINTPFLRGVGGECGGRAAREEGREEMAAKGRKRENYTWKQADSLAAGQ